jgi:hypothetical protein
MSEHVLERRLREAVLGIEEKKEQIAGFNKQVKAIRTQTKNEEQKCVHAMKEMRKVVIDLGGGASGYRGPYVILAKDNSGGSFSKEEQVRFFTQLLTHIQQGNSISPEQCVEELKRFKSSLAERRLVLKKVTYIHSATELDIDELIAWEQGRDSA